MPGEYPRRLFDRRLLIFYIEIFKYLSWYCMNILYIYSGHIFLVFIKLRSSQVYLAIYILTTYDREVKDQPLCVSGMVTCECVCVCEKGEGLGINII